MHFDFCFLKGKGKINDQGNTWSGTGQNKVIKYERWEFLHDFFTTTLFQGDLNFGAFSDILIDNFSYCLEIQMLAGDRLLSQTLKSRALA